MKKEDPIVSLSIEDLIADTGWTKLVNDFHVFKSSEIDIEKRKSTPARIDHFVIVLTLEGTAHIRINLIDHFVKKHGLLIISPNVIHEFVKEENCDFIGIGFIPEFFSHVGLDKKHADAFTFFSSQSDPHFELNDEEAAILRQLMLLLYEKDRSGIAHYFKDEVIHHAFNMLMFELANIAKTQRGDKAIKLTRKEEIMMAFLRILPDHFKEERSVQFYADQLFITPKHLTKTVKELTNKTCGEFIDDMVIIEAKVLLNDPSFSICNVADLLNFSDQFFFSKFFKKQTGLTPTEFRTGR